MSINLQQRFPQLSTILSKLGSLLIASILLPVMLVYAIGEVAICDAPIPNKLNSNLERAPDRAYRNVVVDAL